MVVKVLLVMVVMMVLVMVVMMVTVVILFMLTLFCLRQVQLPVLKDNYEEFEMDTFLVPDGCECSLTRGGED